MISSENDWRRAVILISKYISIKIDFWFVVGGLLAKTANWVFNLPIRLVGFAVGDAFEWFSLDKFLLYHFLPSSTYILLSMSA
jgi:hypothetical protein